MSLIDTFKLIGDSIADFANWEYSGILFLGVISIPIVIFIFDVIKLFARCCYYEKKK